MATVLACTLLGCASPRRGADWRQATTSIKVFGTLDAHIVGYYVRDGEHHTFMQALPFTLVNTGLSEVEIRKAKPEDSITAEVQQKGRDMETSVTNLVAGPGTTGLHIHLKNGFSVEQLHE